MTKEEFSHAFVVCAYKESKYLDKCIQSLLAQSKPTKIIICTSTYCSYIQHIADEYSLPLYVRGGKSDIQKDWNFGCRIVDTDWVTVAHQDDCYDTEYVNNLYKAVEKEPDALIYFTDYRPIKHGEIGRDINSKIRRLLRLPMKCKHLSNKIWAKKMILCFGNSICCPSVSYNRKKIGGDIFTSELKFGLDWDTYYKFAKMPGRFLYVDKVLTYYRIHRQAASMGFIENQIREKEDMIMFQKFWPRCIAKFLMVFYKKAYNTYGEEEE